jgi:catechol 2,3-dioxygenase-like lactoylglutathione lyase family enzyme
MNGVIHHLEIYVSDLKATTAFWEWLLTEKFSYKMFQKWDCGISFKLAETYIVFVQTEKKYIESSYNRKNTGLNHLAFHCSSREFVDTLTKELKEKNIHMLYTDKHPYAGGENYYAVFFEDPDRIKVEVVAGIE